MARRLAMVPPTPAYLRRAGVQESSAGSRFVSLGGQLDMELFRERTPFGSRPDVRRFTLRSGGGPRRLPSNTRLDWVAAIQGTRARPVTAWVGARERPFSLCGRATSNQELRGTVQKKILVGAAVYSWKGGASCRDTRLMGGLKKFQQSNIRFHLSGLSCREDGLARMSRDGAGFNAKPPGTGGATME